MWELLSGQQPIPGGWQCFIAINSFDTPITLLVAHIMPGWHEVTPGHYKILCTFRTQKLRRSKIPGFEKPGTQKDVDIRQHANSVSS